MSAHDVAVPVRRLKEAADEPARVSLRAAGLTQPFIDGVLRPFFAGVFLEPDLETSSRMLHLVWRSMIRGRISLPAGGIAAVPEQLAGRLPEDCLKLESPVERLRDEGVLLADGRDIRARTVVVATGAAEAAHLVPGLPAAATRAVTTFYHVADRSPLRRPIVLVDGEGEVLNTVVLTDVCPAYAPEGRTLISTSVLGEAGPADEKAVRERLAVLYGCDTGKWDFLAHYAIPDALPAMLPPWPLSRPTKVAPHRYVCGDHRATGSVQGAMASGARAAREVLADLEGEG
jgi:phytoene dehydrogenase-like protein